MGDTKIFTLREGRNLKTGTCSKVEDKSFLINLSKENDDSFAWLASDLLIKCIKIKIMKDKLQYDWKTISNYLQYYI